MADIGSSNKTVQSFGWATLIMIIGFMVSLYAVVSWQITPLENRVVANECKIQDTNNRISRLEARILILELWRSRDELRQEVQENEISRHEERLNRIEKELFPRRQ